VRAYRAVQVGARGREVCSIAARWKCRRNTSRLKGVGRSKGRGTEGRSRRNKEEADVVGQSLERRGPDPGGQHPDQHRLPRQPPAEWGLPGGRYL